MLCPKCKKSNAHAQGAANQLHNHKKTTNGKQRIYIDKKSAQHSIFEWLKKVFVPLKKHFHVF